MRWYDERGKLVDNEVLRDDVQERGRIAVAGEGLTETADDVGGARDFRSVGAVAALGDRSIGSELGRAGKARLGMWWWGFRDAEGKRSVRRMRGSTRGSGGTQDAILDR